MNDVLMLFEGLTRPQVKALNVLALPVLGELRRAVVTGENLLVIELDQLPLKASNKPRPRKGQRRKDGKQ